jgi:hypothetical protein
MMSRASACALRSEPQADGNDGVFVLTPFQGCGAGGEAKPAFDADFDCDLES